MKFQLYTDTVLSCDLPKHHLKKGDVVKVVEQHGAVNGVEGYSIEAFNALGDTIAVTTVPETGLDPLREDEILCTRRLAHA